jgi:DMSO/TMAO reductase YedYZ molybdopterin-dependent catalytic subunit
MPAIVEDGPRRLIPRWSPPLALEMPIDGTTLWITPAECFYVLNRAVPFGINAEKWSLTVAGEVDHPLRLTLAALNRLEQVEVINTLECAGNGRAFFEPQVSGIPWRRGAVGNAVFRGPRLCNVLKHARIRDRAKHVEFTGIDDFRDPKLRFSRSVPLEKALDPDTILATSMNGVALSPEHGFPVRALVPGWIGAASVKRVGAIHLLAHEAQGEFMQDAYRLPLDTGLTPLTNTKPEASVALTSLRVKSVITKIAETGQVGQPIMVYGAAWAGESGISKVEVSADSGETWHRAALQPAAARYAWRFWQYSWTPVRSGQYRITAKATDTEGRTQPGRPKWNPRGYLWNGVDFAFVRID